MTFRTVRRFCLPLLLPLPVSFLWSLGCGSGDDTTTTDAETQSDGGVDASADATKPVDGGHVHDGSVESGKEKDGGKKDTGVTADAGNCPVVNAATATPDTAAVGSSVLVSASASGPSVGTLTYAWSAPSGTFDTPKAAQANFTCTTLGPVTLTLTVGDGALTADGGACEPAVTTVDVMCGHVDAASKLPTATKIKHLILIFGENISFDHYFGTYPTAKNLAGESVFNASAGTPVANNLATPLDPTKGFAPIGDAGLLTNNPNLVNANNTVGATNPFRLSPSQAATEDETHNYKPEQQADDDGGMDLFPLFTGFAGPPPSSPPIAATTGLVMAYYDGNTTSAMWDYAQKYAMGDNAWTTNFGPSTPGAINLISGQTNGFAATNRSPTLMSPNHVVSDGIGGYTLIGDTDPLGDVCSTAADQTMMAGKNVGDLLNTGGVSWGWFEGGFDLTITNANGTTGCNRLTVQTVPNAAYNSNDYVPHHEPFQYYTSTANPTHARPSSVAAVGSSVE